MVPFEVFEEKITILREVFPDFRIRKGYEFVTFCPSERCQSQYGNDKRKLEINLRDNKFACWRCHYSGSPIRLLKDFGHSSHRRRYAKEMGFTYDGANEKDRIELPAEYRFVLDHQCSMISNHALEWLENLGVSRDVVFQNRVGFCDGGKYRNRLIFPSFDASGKLNYFVTRHLYDNNEYKWLNCQSSMRENVFNELFVDWSKPVILVESVKAYLKHFEGIENLVCGNGTKISSRHRLFEQIVLNDVPQVFVAFDAEADEEAMAAMNKFYEYGIETRFVKFDDAVQPDEIETAEFASCIEKAGEFEKVDLLKNRIRNLL